MSISTPDASNLQAQLADKVLGLFDSVASERAKYYYNNTIPQQRDVGSIIAQYARANAVISGGATLIPGPLGMVATLPELIIIIRNQIAMIYDIGMAYDHGRVLQRELLASILISALGTSSATLLTMHGGKILVKRASLRVFQKVIALLAGKVTQQLLKSMISKWLPVVGAAAMAAWANYATHRIGKYALTIFEQQIEYETDVIEDMPDTEVLATSEHNDELDRLKIQSLINLMKIDGHMKPKEREYIQTIIAQVGFSVDEQAQFQEDIEIGDRYTIDYTAFRSLPDEAVGLLLDLVALSRRDGQTHILEKLYIKQVGGVVGISESDINEMMTSE